ncbi:MAG: plasmid mobilization relaxosome protein MobC [Eubacterium sp.]|nr:plasmid mobilization relaxosome protein MobC [Eubacterium sp.]
MRKRNNRVSVRFTDEELDHFKRLVERTGLSAEEYLRQIIRGVVPRNSPPADYYKMMRQLYRVGNSLNQIAQKAHVLNVMDRQRYDRAVAEFEQAVRNITEAIILPEKM